MNDIETFLTTARETAKWCAHTTTLWTEDLQPALSLVDLEEPRQDGPITNPEDKLDELKQTLEHRAGELRQRQALASRTQPEVSSLNLLDYSHYEQWRADYPLEEHTIENWRHAEEVAAHEREVDWETQRPVRVNRRRELVEAVAKKRRELMRDTVIAPIEPVDLVHGGRFLICTPANNIPDGGPGAFTDGLFNGEDLPPWDTWVYYACDDPTSSEERWYLLEGYLIAWIPNEYVEMANVGVEVQFLDCLKWLPDVRSEFVKEIEQAMGLH